MVGRPVDIARRGPLSFVHPEDRVAALRAFVEISRGHDVRSTLDLRVLAACGAHHVLETTFAGMVSVTGQRSVVAFGLDAADRRADAVRLREVVSRLHGAVMVVDRAGYIRLANDAVARVFGDRVDEWTWQHERAALDALTAMCREPARAAERLADLTWTYESRTVRLDLADGRTVAVHRAPLAGAGLDLDALWEFRDVTAEADAARARQRKPADVPAEPPGRLLAFVSAALRGPLAAVANSAEVFTDTGAHRLRDAERRATQVITRNTRQLLSLVDDLQLLSRLEGGQFSPRRERLVLPELVDAAAEAWQASATAAGIALTCRTRQGVPAAGDIRCLRRILDILLHNALKFSAPGSAVVLSARPDPPHWTIEVADGGIGIPRAELERVTRAFERGSNAVTAGFPGFGLGLALCGRLVALHQGTMTIDSSVGAGTTVRITLPGPEPGSRMPCA